MTLEGTLAEDGLEGGSEGGGGLGSKLASSTFSPCLAGS